jgi:hypothetical protein
MKGRIIDYKSERRKQSHFSRWGEVLFGFPKAIILGGYSNAGLEAISVSYLVEDVLIYATFFCSTESLRLNVSDLMLHSIREMAAKSESIRYIFAGVYHGKTGTADFYLLRGCKIITKPALNRVNRLILFLLKTLKPKRYEQLCGQYKRTEKGDEE